MLLTDGEEPCSCGYCANNGMCERGIGKCYCNEDYTGIFCTTHIDDITSCGTTNELKCYNGGNCKSTILQWLLVILIRSDDNANQY